MTAIETDLTTVPYKGTAPAMNDLLGGQVDLMCDQTTNTTSQIKGGKIKVYGVTTGKRVPSLPNVPTLNEAGLPNFEVAVWHALYAPKGTPKPVVDGWRGPASRPQGRHRQDALRRARDGAGERGPSEAGSASGAPQGRDRQVGPDHQEGRGLRRLRRSACAIPGISGPGSIYHHCSGWPPSSSPGTTADGDGPRMGPAYFPTVLGGAPAVIGLIAPWFVPSSRGSPIKALCRSAGSSWCSVPPSCSASSCAGPAWPWL